MRKDETVNPDPYGLEYYEKVLSKQEKKGLVNYT